MSTTTTVRTKIFTKYKKKEKLPIRTSYRTEYSLTTIYMYRCFQWNNIRKWIILGAFCFLFFIDLVLVCVGFGLSTRFTSGLNGFEECFPRRIRRRRIFRFSEFTEFVAMSFDVDVDVNVSDSGAGHFGSRRVLSSIEAPSATPPPLPLHILAKETQSRYLHLIDEFECNLSSGFGTNISMVCQDFLALSYTYFYFCVHCMSMDTTPLLLFCIISIPLHPYTYFVIVV